MLFITAIIVSMSLLTLLLSRISSLYPMSVVLTVQSRWKISSRVPRSLAAIATDV